jgi:hypothetical protein
MNVSLVVRTPHADSLQLSGSSMCGLMQHAVLTCSNRGLADGDEGKSGSATISSIADDASLVTSMWAFVLSDNRLHRVEFFCRTL